MWDATNVYMYMMLCICKENRHVGMPDVALNFAVKLKLLFNKSLLI